MNKKYKFDTINKGELSKYLEEMNNGNIEARNKLIYHYSNNIIKYINKNFNNKINNKDDLIQTCILELIEILNRFKKNDLILLNSKINYNINLKIKKHINSINSTNNIIIEDNTNIEEKFENLENINIITNSIKKLSEKKQKIIYLYFYNHYSMKKIANIFNVSHQYIHQMLNASINFIKQQVFFYSIDFKDDYSIIKSINNYLGDDYFNRISDEEKIKLFFKYINNLSKEDKEIICINFYNNISIKELVNIYQTDEKEILNIINNFILIIKNKINLGFYDNNLKYNSILFILWDRLTQFTPEEIKLSLEQLIKTNKAILNRYINCNDIKVRYKLISIIVSKIEKILKDNNNLNISNEKSKKIVKIKN